MSTFQDRRQARADVTIDILPPEDGRGKVIHFRRPSEVVDAHFVSVDETRRRRAKATSRNVRLSSGSAVRLTVDRHVSSVLGAMEKRLLRLRSDSFLALVATIFVGVFMLCGGLSLVSASEQAIDPGPPLDITHVTMTPQDANGMRVLLINGIVENRTGDLLAMPSIRAELISGETVVASTLINTETARIGGRESYGFSARVPHPGGKLPDLRLSLAERGV
jgi:hypothetical protein